MSKLFSFIMITLITFFTIQKASSDDLTGNIGLSLYGGIVVPTNGNITTDVKTTDFLKVGPQFGIGVSYFLTKGFGLEVMANWGVNGFKDKYKEDYKNPNLSNISVSLDGIYNFGYLLGNSIIEPYAKAGVGVYNWSYRKDWLGKDIINNNGDEYKGTNFGFNAGIGIDFIPPSNTNFRVGLLFEYNMYFPKDEDKFGKEFAEQGYLNPQIKFSYLIPTH